MCSKPNSLFHNWKMHLLYQWVDVGLQREVLQPSISKLQLNDSMRLASLVRPREVLQDDGAHGYVFSIVIIPGKL